MDRSALDTVRRLVRALWWERASTAVQEREHHRAPPTQGRCSGTAQSFRSWGFWLTPWAYLALGVGAEREHLVLLPQPGARVKAAQRQAAAVALPRVRLGRQVRHDLPHPILAYVGCKCQVWLRLCTKLPALCAACQAVQQVSTPVHEWAQACMAGTRSHLGAHAAEEAAQLGLLREVQRRCAVLRIVAVHSDTPGLSRESCLHPLCYTFLYYSIHAGGSTWKARTQFGQCKIRLQPTPISRGQITHRHPKLPGHMRCI